MPTSALRIPATVALEAAFFVCQQAAAIRALPGQVLGQAIVLKRVLIITTTGMFLQHFGDGIGTGEHRLALLPGDGWAADATELPYHRGDVYTSPQS